MTSALTTKLFLVLVQGLKKPFVDYDTVPMLKVKKVYYLYCTGFSFSSKQRLSQEIFISQGLAFSGHRVHDKNTDKHGL